MRSANTVLAAVVVLLAACSKSDSYRTDSAGGVVGATTTPAAAPLPAPPPSTVMTDQNIVAKIGGADSAEVELAKLAQTKATNAAVKSFARLLATDHLAHAKEVAALETKANLTPLPQPSDMSAQEHRSTLGRFQSMPKGVDFDTAFVNYQVEDHQKELSEVQSLESQAQNADVKALLAKTIPALQKHLDKAQEVQKKLSATK
jgi:putative membrane protein